MPTPPWAAKNPNIRDPDDRVSGDRRRSAVARRRPGMGVRSSRPSTRAASSMSSMGRAMTSSAPASRSAIRSSTEFGLGERQHRDRDAGRGSAFSRATTSVASISGVRSTTTRLASTARSSAERTERRRDDAPTQPRQGAARRAASARSAHRRSSDRSEDSTAATLAGVRGSLDRSYGAGTKVGPSRAYPGPWRIRCRGPGDIIGRLRKPCRAPSGSLLYSRLVLSAPPCGRPCARPNPSGAYPKGRSTNTRASL